MASIKFKDSDVALLGEMPKVGQKAPDFTITLGNLSDKKLSEIDAKVKVLLCMPSLDTSTCAMETKRFNTELNGFDEVETLIITKDLPFAMNRFCSTEGLEKVKSASDFRYNDFAKNYGVEIGEGALKGLHARAVFVLDQSNTITYTELVSEVSAEPNYEATLAAVKANL